MCRSLPVYAASLLLLLCGVTAQADDAFYRLALGDLELTEGELPTNLERPDWNQHQRAQMMRPRVVIDGEGEAYVEGNFSTWNVAQWPTEARVLIHTPQARDVTGRLTFPKQDFSGMVLLKFRVEADQADDDAKEAFHQAKSAHFNRLLQRDLPGSAWFRHQQREATKALGRKPDDVTQPMTGRPVRRGPRNLAATYALFSGGRAISENLQLDRALPPLGEETDMVEVDSIRGITVEEIDWQPLIKGKRPKSDPLAAMIPADQHAVFFPSFASAIRLADEVRKQGGLVTQLAQPRTEDQRIQTRYERQLALPLSTLSRLLGPKLVTSVALTGSDPYFATGTDVAVVLKSPSPNTLKKMLAAQVMLLTAGNGDLTTEQGEIAGLEYRVARTPDRRVCSYLAANDEVVIITNSPYQLERLGQCMAGKTKPIASLPEYKFFRDRYPLGDASETALIFLSDATIRRWCGPRWRIGASRRVRAAAVMAEVQAGQMDALAAGAEPGAIYTDLPTTLTGKLRLTPDGVISEQAGGLAFLTPIAEMDIEKVTEAEKQAYEQWRDGYQRNWSWAFDPIALRVGTNAETLSADLTVMPLIARSEYRQWIEVSRGAKIGPDAGDRHSTLAHVILAINTESTRFKQMGGLIESMARGVSLGWIGETVEFYADPAPFWKELAEMPPDEFEDFFQENFDRVPIGVRIGVESPLKLTMFLTALRAFIEQTAPGMTTWETREHAEQPYVRMGASEKARREMGERGPEDPALYYAAGGDALVLSLSEDLIKRSLERRAQRMSDDEQTDEETSDEKPSDEGQSRSPTMPSQPWLGESFCLNVDRHGVMLAIGAGSPALQAEMQSRAWGNLYILNEWRRRFPESDPLALHQRVWNTQLTCPGGGDYVWNEKWRTYQSSLYGHPGEPKQGPIAPAELEQFRRGRFGLTFEEQGLRARVELDRDQDSGPAAETSH